MPTTATASRSGGEARAETPSPAAQEKEPELGGTTVADVTRLKEVLKEKMRGSSSGDAPTPPRELRPKFCLRKKSTL